MEVHPNKRTTAVLSRPIPATGAGMTDQRADNKLSVTAVSGLGFAGTPAATEAGIATVVANGGSVDVSTIVSREHNAVSAVCTDGESGQEWSTGTTRASLSERTRYDSRWCGEVASAAGALASEGVTGAARAPSGEHRCTGQAKRLIKRHDDVGERTIARD